MPQAWVGLNVQVPVDPLDNSGADKTSATITRVHLDETSNPVDGPHGGVMVDLRVMPNSADPSYFLAAVELVNYAETARDTGLGLGVGLGAWPLDG